MMKTITVRDLRLRWRQTEEALQLEGEITVTRDSIPVARLVRISADVKRGRWNPKAHARWQRKVAPHKVTSSDEALALSRSNRRFK